MGSILYLIDALTLDAFAKPGYGRIGDLSWPPFWAGLSTFWIYCVNGNDRAHLKGLNLRVWVKLE